MNRITFIAFLSILLLLINCTKKDDPVEVEMEPVYSTQAEFVEALDTLASIAEANNIIAYKDTLEDGYPDVEGESFPLTEFISDIRQKIEEGKLIEAAQEVYHFDGTPFSLISFIMKANLAENISLETMSSALALIPLPPVQMAGFAAPKKAKKVQPPPKCKCNPSMKILVTWSYTPPCGNYEGNKTSGYAANNTLTNMRTGVFFRFDAEIDGCLCGGGKTVIEVIAPPNARYGYSAHGTRCTFVSETSGTYTIKFTYTCACDKKKVVTEKFVIGF